MWVFLKSLVACSYFGLQERTLNTGLKISIEEFPIALEAPNLTHLRLFGDGTTLPTDLSKQYPTIEHLELFYLTNIDEIPEEFFTFPNLKELHIVGSNLGTIPVSISELEIEHLVISHNNLLTSIPNLPNIQTSIEIHNNQSLKKIPSKLGNQSTIRHINLANNSIRRIPLRFSEYSSLGSLRIDGNKLLKLPQDIFSISTLHTINIADNPLLSLPTTDRSHIKILRLHNLDNLTKIPDLSGFLELEELSIRSCLNVNTIPSGLEKIPHFKILEIIGTGFTEVPATITYLNSLHTLIFRMNSSLQTLAVDLTLPPSLQSIVMDQNSLYIQRDFVFPTNLKFLKLDENNIDILPDSVCSLPLLEELSLGNNPMHSFCEDLPSLQNLRSLNLLGVKLRQIPLGIEDLNSLEFLSFGNKELESAPMHLGKLKNLKQIRFLHNDLPSHKEMITNLEKNLPSTIEIEVF
jgi:Leucine-rich repeat (LRR) protein